MRCDIGETEIAECRQQPVDHAVAFGDRELLGIEHRTERHHFGQIRLRSRHQVPNLFPQSTVHTTHHTPPSVQYARSAASIRPESIAAIIAA